MKGFTLIELLIVVAVIAILAAIAIPNYDKYVKKSHRTEGTETLNNIRLAQEDYRANNANYGDLTAVWGGKTATDNGYYALSITNTSATGFTTTATAQGKQVSDSEQGTSCKVLTLVVNGLNTTRTPTACW